MLMFGGAGTWTKSKVTISCSTRNFIISTNEKGETNSFNAFALLVSGEAGPLRTIRREDAGYSIKFSNEAARVHYCCDVQNGEYP